MNFYATQERKLFDDTVFSTQAPDQMAKPLRQLMQEWTESRNMNKEPILGMRFPKRFRWRVTLRQPGGVEQTAISHRIVKMDTKLADCYDTLAGVGIMGRGDPAAERGARGIRWQYALAMGSAALCLVLVGILLGGKSAFSLFQKSVVGMIGIDTSGGKPTSALAGAVGMTGGLPDEMKQNLAASIERNPPARVHVITNLMLAPNDIPKVVNNSLIGGRAEEVVVEFVGLSIGAGHVRVYLSDGRRLTEKDPGLSYVSRDLVIYRKERIYPSRGRMESKQVSSVIYPRGDLAPKLSRRVVVGGKIVDDVRNSEKFYTLDLGFESVTQGNNSQY